MIDHLVIVQRLIPNVASFEGELEVVARAVVTWVHHPASLLKRLADALVALGDYVDFRVFREPVLFQPVRKT